VLYIAVLEGSNEVDEAPDRSSPAL